MRINLSRENWTSSFKWTPATHTSLNLSRNKLGGMSIDELIQIFAAIPASVTSLDLGLNQLYQKKVKN